MITITAVVFIGNNYTLQFHLFPSIFIVNQFTCNLESSFYSEYYSISESNKYAWICFKQNYIINSDRFTLDSNRK